MPRILLVISLCLMIFDVHAKEVINKLPLPPHPAGSFSQAKKNLYKIYKQDSERKTFYCGCNFDSKNQIDLKSCGYAFRKNEARAKRVEAEHVFPAAQFGNFRVCWREPQNVCGSGITGRKCCEMKDPLFETAHNDLHNLYPAIGEVNGDRSNFNWGMIPNAEEEYGKCEIKIDESIRRAEPPDAVKGNIARTMFYMSATYGFRLSDQDVQLYTAWNKQDPVDAWEIERNKRIAEIQGNLNPFIADNSNELDSSLVGEDATTTAVLNDDEDDDNDDESALNKAGFNCSTKKTCGQMASCEEAKYHLTVCKNMSLDKDGDGIPCASICK
ncbi:endonuclease [Beggiatoa leptomitoformis]|uniref:Endonuclease n=1 Tax=Beggiatoa leptomitoformis TaxID=288004 RepID=A0A2N9YCV5_9GAMM|nr:endonuclease [Beggiatoa leptomitoformis]AUI68287.1 endonuclease [Beggiatoa leptomitoformis]QGX03426.1 endonuclease [Beggiatoa leptomitoformis]